MERRAFLAGCTSAALLSAKKVWGKAPGGGVFIPGPAASTEARAGQAVNLARYGELQSWISPETTRQLREWMWGNRGSKTLRLGELAWKDDEFDVGVEWPEFRTIDKIVVRFAGRIPAPDHRTLEHWEGLTELQGSWKPIQPRHWESSEEQGAWTLTVPPFRTDKVRLRLRGDRQVSLETIEIYGPSKWKSGEVRIEWGHLPSVQSFGGTIESYNGEVVEIAPFGAARLKGPFAWEATAGNGAINGITARVLYAWGMDVDRTIITLRTEAGTLSFLPGEAIEEQPIDVPDFGVYVRNNAIDLDRAAYRRRNAGRSRILDAVARQPEQTLEKAYQKIHANPVTAFVGVDSNSQKFGIAPDGHVMVAYNDPTFGRAINSHYALYFETEAVTAPFENPSDTAPTPSGTSREKEQSLADGWLPILTTKWGLKTNVNFERTDFAVLADVPYPYEESNLTGDEPALMISRLRIRNDSPASKTAYFYLRPWKPEQGLAGYGSMPGNPKNAWQVDLRDHFVVVREEDARSVICYWDSHGQGSLSLVPSLNAVRYSVKIAPGDEHLVHMVIPGRPRPLDDVSGLTNQAYDNLQKSTAEYWTHKSGTGMQLEIPDAHLQHLYNASLHHFLISFTKDSKRGEYYANTAALYYGPIGSESSPIIQALDMRGLHHLAEQCLKAFLSTQGDSVPDGEYSGKAGGFYHYRPWYSIDQGFVLWALAEHYLYSGDKAWLKSVAGQMVKGCDFIIRGRKLTKRKSPGGGTPLYDGFAPAGTIGDPRSWKYSFMISGYFYLGLKKCSQVLREVDPENANRIETEAEDFLKDIRRGMKRITALAPVTRLRDNTSVPCVPPFVTLRGFTTDVKDGVDPDPRFAYASDSTVGALHLLKCEVLAPHDPEVSWILNALEDRFFMFSPSKRDRVRLEDIGLDWFNLGGFDKMQPYYLHYQEAYLRRNQIPNFLRGFFNTLAAIADPQNLTFQEELDGGGGQPQKTHEESWFLQQLRMMLLWEKGNDLHLAWGTPRCWLEEGKTIAVHNAPSYFGQLSYRILSHVDKGRIEATLKSPRRKRPASFYLRFRHPRQARMTRVTVNGRPWQDFDPAKEWIRLDGSSEEVNVVAHY